MPNLLIASGIFHPEAGGPATYLYELLPELLRRGWDIRVLSYGDPNGKRENLAPLPEFGEGVGVGSDYPYPLTRIPRQSLPVRTLNYARAARPLLKWAEVVYVHTLGLPLYGDHHAPRIVKIVGDLAWERAVRKGWIAPTTDIDAFQTMRAGLPADGLLANRLLAGLGETARAREARGMDGVIVPSEYLKRMVIGWGVDERRVRVIYNALPPETRSVTLTQGAARARLNLPAAPIFLTVGRLLPWKGVDHLISALANVPAARLIVAGDGDILPALRTQAERLKLADRVTFLGRVSREQMPVYMRAADYVALYSGYEGLSHTLLESLRVGTPVIASDKGGNPEVVRHDVNGLLVPYVDVDALTDTLRAAIQPGKRNQLAANSGVGMERFDFAHMVEATHNQLLAFSG